MQKETKTPATCPHCGKVVGRAPGWLHILEAMAPGKGQSEPALTVAAIATKAGLSRQRVEQLIPLALQEKMLEPAPGFYGIRVLKRTWYGRQILNRWKSAGWRKA